MTFQFLGLLFPGINERTEYDPPATANVRTGYWGLHGESEIRSGRRGRQIKLRTVLRSEAQPYQTYEDLAAVLYQLETMVNEHGELSIFNLDNGVSRTWPNCTFEGFQLGQNADDGPLPDVGGAMGGGWWVRITCTWYDLGPIV